jgi:hypothetical protein
MTLRLKEDPKVWRQSTWLSALGVALASTALCWRGILPAQGWVALLSGTALLALCVWLRPQWFRGYYRFSTRMGFWSSQLVARVVLALVFLLLITPLALLFRLSGKDALRLKRKRDADSYWQPAKETSPLDRQF